MQYIAYQSCDEDGLPESEEHNKLDHEHLSMQWMNIGWNNDTIPFDWYDMVFMKARNQNNQFRYSSSDVILTNNSAVLYFVALYADLRKWFSSSHVFFKCNVENDETIHRIACKLSV